MEGRYIIADFSLMVWRLVGLWGQGTSHLFFFPDSQSRKDTTPRLLGGLTSLTSSKSLGSGRFLSLLLLGVLSMKDTGWLNVETGTGWAIHISFSSPFTRLDRILGLVSDGDLTAQHHSLA